MTRRYIKAQLHSKHNILGNFIYHLTDSSRKIIPIGVCFGFCALPFVAFSTTLHRTILCPCFYIIVYGVVFVVALYSNDIVGIHCWQRIIYIPTDFGNFEDLTDCWNVFVDQERILEWNQLRQLSQLYFEFHIDLTLFHLCK